MAYDYEYFKKEILALTSIDLNCYKEKQMKRRIDTLIAKHKIVGYIILPSMFRNFTEILSSGS